MDLYLTLLCNYLRGIKFINKRNMKMGSVAANILTKNLWTADKVWSFSLEDEMLTTPQRTKLIILKINQRSLGNRVRVKKEL